MKYLGRNYRLTDFQAALGISQLSKLDDFLSRRTRIADRYHALLGHFPGLSVPVTKSCVRHAWHLYTILLEKPNRDAVFHALRAAGIGVNVHYIPTYSFTYYRERFNFNPSDYPVTEDVFSHIITLPLYPQMTYNDINTVVATTKQVIEGTG
jgi:dTDP-4-amino-4,6-dideoxygalactose transaminase